MMIKFKMINAVCLDDDTTNRIYSSLVTLFAAFYEQYWYEQYRYGPELWVPECLSKHYEYHNTFTKQCLTL